MIFNFHQGFDAELIKKWVGKDKLLEQTESDEITDTYCVLVEDEDGSKRFIRFFLMGGKTQVSVDWDEARGSAMETLFMVFTNKFAA